MPGPYTFPTDRVTGGPAPAADFNALAAAFNEATPLATPNVLALRDESGRFQAADPVADEDVATKGWVNDQGFSTGGGGGSNEGGATLWPGFWGLPSLVPWGSSTESLANNTFYGQRFRVGKDMNFDRYGLRVTTAAGAGSTFARIGMYKLVSGTWTLEHDAGTVTIDTTGVKEISVSRTLTPGDYVVGCLSNDYFTIESMKFRHSMGMRDNGGNPIFSGVQFPRWWAATQAYGALPSTLALAPLLDWDVTFSTVLLRGA